MREMIEMCNRTVVHDRDDTDMQTRSVHSTPRTFEKEFLAVAWDRNLQIVQVLTLQLGDHLHLVASVDEHGCILRQPNLRQPGHNGVGRRC
jgi:hypothetical protein